jgi:RsiW-degrading membrane proteinase PrsW (M82 family)
MTQEQYPPPPPPSSSPKERGFHVLRTNFFARIASRLDGLEQQTLHSGPRRSVRFGLIIALIFSATAGFLIAFVIEYPIPLSIALLTVIAPLIEEPVKAISMFIVAFYVWRAVPSRRYGAALGAASGLGFGVAESLVAYIIPFALAGKGEAVATRILVTPILHPLWSAFVGIGIFTLAAKRSKLVKVQFTFPLLFLGIAYLNHICWNSLSLGLGLAIQSSIALVAFLTAIILFPIFALILRDILGGHFNFRHFLESLPEQKARAPVPPPPPPPPPP